VIQVSIVALIYQSPSFAKDFYSHLRRVTPELSQGSAEFFFVANNATTSVLTTLQRELIPFVRFERPVLSESEHFAKGFAAPEYIGRVYAAYNHGVQHSQGELVVLLNSDMVLSKCWLHELLRDFDGTSVMSPQLVERHHPRFGVFPGAIEMNFGRDFRTFTSEKWDTFCETYQQTHGQSPFKDGGPYMPAMFKKSWFTEFGGFPEGNLAGGSYSDVRMYGDEAFFFSLSSSGISHRTTSRALCYHFKEGERATTWANFLTSQVVPSMTLPVRRLIRKFVRVRQ
jgi:cellulose synthase/poly-beta-1,6-N-acetylglucosamine synthase-like glycosyltransferase